VVSKVHTERKQLSSSSSSSSSSTTTTNADTHAHHRPWRASLCRNWTNSRALMDSIEHLRNTRSTWSPLMRASAAGSGELMVAEV